MSSPSSSNAEVIRLRQKLAEDELENAELATLLTASAQTTTCLRQQLQLALAENERLRAVVGLLSEALEEGVPNRRSVVGVLTAYDVTEEEWTAVVTNAHTQIHAAATLLGRLSPPRKATAVLLDVTTGQPYVM